MVLVQSGFEGQISTVDKIEKKRSHSGGPYVISK